jgi:hypothetical protein
LNFGLVNHTKRIWDDLRHHDAVRGERGTDNMFSDMNLGAPVSD